MLCIRRKHAAWFWCIRRCAERSDLLWRKSPRRRRREDGKFAQGRH